VVRCPPGVILMIFDEPSLMGNVSRFPTKKMAIESKGGGHDVAPG
jgi:hypothetical protein